MKKVLTIAGSDSSGGAGIQADLKTMLCNGVYGMSVITALTAQNTTGVYGIMPVEPVFLEKQLESVFSDIMPDAVKIGMIFNADQVEVISRILTKYEVENVVVDPVMVATSKASLVTKEAVMAAKELLYPKARLLTPNLSEAEELFENKIEERQEAEKAAKCLGDRFGTSVLLKGGHNPSDANDLLYGVKSDTLRWIFGRRIDNDNTHGTGCTLSSAIASNLAKNHSLYESVVMAKEYINCLLLDVMDLGAGSGPLNHGAGIKYFKSRKTGEEE